MKYSVRGVGCLAWRPPGSRQAFRDWSGLL